MGARGRVWRRRGLEAARNRHRPHLAVRSRSATRRGRRPGPRRWRAARHLAATQYFDLHSPVRLQAFHQLLVVTALGAELLAGVAGHRLGLALTLRSNDVGLRALLGKVVL